MKNMFDFPLFYCNSKIKSIWFTISFYLIVPSHIFSSSSSSSLLFLRNFPRNVSFLWSAHRRRLWRRARVDFSKIVSFQLNRDISHKKANFFSLFRDFLFLLSCCLEMIFLFTLFFLPWTHFQRLNRWILLNLPRYFCTKAIPLHCLDDLPLLFTFTNVAAHRLGLKFQISFTPFMRD